MMDGGSLLIALLAATLVVLAVTVALYAFLSRRMRAGQTGRAWRVLVQVSFSAFTFLLATWPLIYDAAFVEHFPDEASLPGPFFASQFLLAAAFVVWMIYAAFRLSQNSEASRRHP